MTTVDVGDRTQYLWTGESNTLSTTLPTWVLFVPLLKYKKYIATTTRTPQKEKTTNRMHDAIVYLRS